MAEDIGVGHRAGYYDGIGRPATSSRTTCCSVRKTAMEEPVSYIPTR